MLIDYTSVYFISVQLVKKSLLVINSNMNRKNLDISLCEKLDRGLIVARAQTVSCGQCHTLSRSAGDSGRKRRTSSL